MTALELISGAKNQRDVDLIDRLIEAYETIPVDEAIGRRAYELLKLYTKSHGLRTFDSLIAATAIEKQRTLVTKNRTSGLRARHQQMCIAQTLKAPPPATLTKRSPSFPSA